MALFLVLNGLAAGAFGSLKFIQDDLMFMIASVAIRMGTGICGSVLLVSVCSSVCVIYQGCMDKAIGW